MAAVTLPNPSVSCLHSDTSTQNQWMSSCIQEIPTSRSTKEDDNLNDALIVGDGNLEILGEKEHITIQPQDDHILNHPHSPPIISEKLIVANEQNSSVSHCLQQPVRDDVVSFSNGNEKIKKKGHLNEHDNTIPLENEHNHFENNMQHEQRMNKGDSILCQEKQLTIQLTNENELTTNENQLTTNENQLTTNENQLTTIENRLITIENHLATIENQLTTNENQLTTIENQLTTNENQLTTNEDQLTTNEDQWTTRENQLTKQLNNESKPIVDHHKEQDIQIHLIDKKKNTSADVAKHMQLNDHGNTSVDDGDTCPFSPKRSLHERIIASGKLFLSTQVSIVKCKYKKKDIKLEYQISGNPNGKERIVLIMGLLARKETWGLTIEALLRASSDYCILTFDNRGIGNSDKPRGPYTMKELAHDTVQLMSNIGWTSAHIVGVSMGGMIALEVASRYSEFVRTLTLMVTSAGFPRLHFPGLMQLKGLTKASTAALMRDNHKATNRLLRVLYSKKFLHSHVDNEKTNGDMYCEMHMHDFIAVRHSSSIIGQISACLGHRLSHGRLHDIRNKKLPTLIVSASKDEVIRPKCSRSLAKHLAHDKTKLVTFEAGHAVQLECVDEVVEELCSHITKYSTP